jgi:DNA (cytosine-5)-methyltransferase 1
MNVLQFVKIGEHKGVSRVYFDGMRLANAFAAGDFYRLRLNDSGSVSIVKAKQGRKVSRRKKGERVNPVIDCRHSVWSSLFKVGDTLRAVIRAGEIILSRPHQDKRQTEREQRLTQKAQRGGKLSIASLCSGAGVMDAAIINGLSSANVKSTIKLSIERDGDLTDLTLANQSDHFDRDTTVIHGNLEQVDFNHTHHHADMLVAGLACTGASIAGRTKNKLQHAEQHDSAGALFYYFLRAVDSLNPAIVLLENVPSYENTASFAVIKTVLANLGYRLSFQTMNGNDYNAIEGRERLVMLAVSNGLGEVDLDAIPTTPNTRTINDIKERVDNDSQRWKHYDHLKQKAVRDKAAGKGFARKLLTGEETTAPTVRAGYQKAGSCDPYLVHPLDTNKSRLFTAIEHCRLKGIPSALFAGASESLTHRGAGQSVIFPLFETIGRYLGQWLQSPLQLNENLTAA